MWMMMLDGDFIEQSQTHQIFIKCYNMFMEERNMKLNARIYKNLTGEPFLKQEINNKIVEFHYMNDTPFLFQFASKARFAVWASDGVNYKVLIESKYYEAMKPFYEKEINEIWINFLQRVSGINKKINMMFLIPMLFLYAIIAFVASVYFEGYMLQILLGLLGVIIISNMVQNRIVTKRVRQENLDTQNQIRTFIGDVEFEKLIQAQQEHYQAYFKFDVEQHDHEEDHVHSDQEEIETIEETSDNETTKK
jgi:hypothetical protein